MLTEATRRRDFPALEGIHYLNTAAESIPPRCVGEALMEYWADKQRGMKGRDAHFARWEECREVCARILGLSAEEVAFCSCTSEAYNLLASALALGPEDEVIVSDLDFPAGVTPWLRAACPPKTRLWRTREDGALHIEDLEGLLGPRTRLVQVSLISFYNGYRVDWPNLRNCVRRLAPQAKISVDLTQALGRVELDCQDADVLIASSYKWTLGIHGGCIIGLPNHSAKEISTHAGGWFHLEDAFAGDRFEIARAKPGASSFAVGMPNFASVYALRAALSYIESVDVRAISQHADPLVEAAANGLKQLGIRLLRDWDPDNPSGILAFRHPRAEELHAALETAHVHVMHHAGRIRVAVHGYNTAVDIDVLLRRLKAALS